MVGVLLGLGVTVGVALGVGVKVAVFVGRGVKVGGSVAGGRVIDGVADGCSAMGSFVGMSVGKEPAFEAKLHPVNQNIPNR